MPKKKPVRINSLALIRPEVAGDETTALNGLEGFAE